ncbi:MAG: EutN/CcmL family microcompartment protein [Roseovarius sp.]|nr:EutN/CcmL family microcompartment protein [Roseovarius sp.]MCY4207672.1 EutN/CcmL family microcompartment protein [Roseovarius sp.]MCY4292470.1 EutN/CcmL family microcompartment protein [Roseovarius sp.]MCY4314515.1 EutN/CcmL family microcompartment protein [Roseovarius sp.]
MKLCRVTGTVWATVKDAGLVGGKLLVVDRVDTGENVVEAGLVAIDACGAGVGDLVVVATGSAARTTPGMAGAPVDATIVAIVDRVESR